MFIDFVIDRIPAICCIFRQMYSLNEIIEIEKMFAGFDELMSYFCRTFVVLLSYSLHRLLNSYRIIQVKSSQ